MIEELVNGLIFKFGWDPPLIARDPLTKKEVRQVTAGGYKLNSPLYQAAATPGYSIGGIRVDKDASRAFNRMRIARLQVSG